MMISPQNLAIIRFYAQKYNVQTIYLFGSALTSPNEDEAEDIDLAVRGIAPELFFRFYGELLRYLPKPIDLVDLSKKSRFTQLIEEEAVKIYG